MMPLVALIAIHLPRVLEILASPPEVHLESADVTPGDDVTEVDDRHTGVVNGRQEKAEEVRSQLCFRI